MCCGVEVYNYLMNKIIIIAVILALSTLQVNLKMLNFDSILKCAGSIKKVVSNYNRIKNNLSNPLEVIQIASDTFKEIPTLLSGCGKQTYAQLYSKHLSRKCINLMQLQAKLALKIVQYKIQLGSNNLLVEIYQKMEAKVRLHKHKYCAFLNININQIFNIGKQNKCFQKSKNLFQMLKNGIVVEQKSHSIFQNLQEMYKNMSETGMTCIQEMHEYFPMKCLGELNKMLQLILKMQEYTTSTSWIWQNVSGIRLGIQSIRTQCVGLAKIF